MEKNKQTELDEEKRRELSEKLVVVITSQINLKREERKIREELCNVLPLKIKDVVKIQGYKDDYTVENIRIYLDHDHKIGYACHLLQVNTMYNYKYNVDSINITKIK